MAIRVRHAPRYSLVGQQAYTAGRGLLRQRYEDLARDDAQFGAQLAQRERLTELELAQRDLAQRRSLDAQLISQQLGNQAAQRRLMLGAGIDAAGDRRGHEMALERARVAAGEFDRRQAADQEAEELRYSTQQKRELAQINQSMQWVRDRVSSGEWSPEEAAFAESQLNAKRLGIAPMPMPKEPSPWPKGRGVGEQWIDGGRIWTRDDKGVPKDLGVQPDWPAEQGIGRVWTDPQSGARMTRNGKGEIDVLFEPPPPSEPQAATFADFNKEYELIRKGMTRTNPDTGVEEMPKSDEVLQEMQRRRQAFEVSRASEGDVGQRRAAGRQMYQQARGFLEQLLPGMFPPADELADDQVDEMLAGVDDRLMQNVERDEQGNPIVRPAPDHPPVPIPHPTTAEQYERLPEGTTYIHPDGRLMVKE